MLHPESELRQAYVLFDFDILIFQLPPEARHFYIIQTTSPPVHVDLNAMDPKFLYELQAGELEDSVSGATTVIQSLSDPGTPLDNAAAESFFACMKREKLSHNLYETKKELEVDVAEYIDYYNSRRIHQKLDQRTPIEVEEDFLLRNEMNFCPNTVD